MSFKKILTTSTLLAVLCVSSASGDIFLNEINYDEPGTDSGEFIEIAVADSMLSSFNDIRVDLFNQNGNFYGSTLFFADFVEGASSNGFTLFSVTLPSNGLQNGGDDGLGISLTDGTQIQLLSYEGTFTVDEASSTWNGQTSTDIGVFETNGSPANTGLSLVGTGSSAGDFTWNFGVATTVGNVNAGQTFNAIPEPTTAMFAGLALVGLALRRRRK